MSSSSTRGAEALVWHHGVEGLRRALDEAERPNESKEAHRQAVRVARLAGHSYQLFKGADLEERAAILEVWSKRKGSLIRLDWTDGLRRWLSGAGACWYRS